MMRADVSISAELKAYNPTAPMIVNNGAPKKAISSNPKINQMLIHHRLS
jgi:hypothetical protein